MRVHEYAKKLGVSSKSLINFIETKTDIKIKNHMSSLTEEDIKKIEDALPSKGETPPEPQPKAKTKKPRKTHKPKERQEAAAVQTDEPAQQAQAEPVAQPEPMTEEKEEKKDEKKKEYPYREVEIEVPISVRDLAVRLSVKLSELIEIASENGITLVVDQLVDIETAVAIAQLFNAKVFEAADIESKAIRELNALKTQDLKPRPPIVTIMGHVDHGKTSLLDYIRKSNVTAGEYGGITQHIGAYIVDTKFGRITFLDTPGHEAFTAMRARGANVTDIVILVVAADDGVMAQTIEAINHAKAANVPIVVALNKIDKRGVDIDKVKRQLMEHDLMPEEWGGKTVVVPVSAVTGEGVDSLLEMVLLEAELLELKANRSMPACGVVVEAKMDKFKGVTATLLVQHGTLKAGDIVVVGDTWGKIKGITNDRGQRVPSLAPSEAGEVLGINEVPLAGDMFYVVQKDQVAKEIVEYRKQKKKESAVKQETKVSLDNIFEVMKGSLAKELRVVLKSDVQGSLEAVKASLEKLSTQDIELKIIHAAVGPVNASDVLLADASDAIIIGFNVPVDSQAKKEIERRGVEVRTYKIIYELIDQIKSAMEGLLEPIVKEIEIGRAEVRQVFTLSKAGRIAGSYVREGKIVRNYGCKLLRNGSEIARGKITSLKRFKDDAREVAEGYECGIGISSSEPIYQGDVIVCFEEQKILRKIK